MTLDLEARQDYKISKNFTTHFIILDSYSANIFTAV